MSKVIFEETQRFNQWWIWLMILLSISVVTYLGYEDYRESQDLRAFLSLAIFAPFILFILLIKLKTRIDERGIHVQFFPLHFSFKSYLWKDIYSAEVVQYSPIGDYGGWGYRISFKGKGKAFNVRGNKGIKIHTDEGKTRMIGTQRMEEAQACIRQYQEAKA